MPYCIVSKGVAHRLNSVYVNALRSKDDFQAFEKIFNDTYNHLYNSTVRFKLFQFLESQHNIDKKLIQTQEIRWISILLICSM